MCTAVLLLHANASLGVPVPVAGGQSFQNKFKPAAEAVQAIRARSAALIKTFFIVASRGERKGDLALVAIRRRIESPAITTFLQVASSRCPSRCGSPQLTGTSGQRSDPSLGR